MFVRSVFIFLIIHNKNQIRFSQFFRQTRMNKTNEIEKTLKIFHDRKWVIITDKKKRFLPSLDVFQIQSIFFSQYDSPNNLSLSHTHTGTLIF